MKFKFLQAAVIGLMLSVCNIANAGIINTTNSSFIDNTTNLEWMDFGVNNQFTYNYVAGQLSTGGVYDGWSLATEDQVITLWNNMFYSLVGYTASSVGTYLSLKDIQNNLNVTTGMYENTWQYLTQIIGANLTSSYNIESIGLFKTNTDRISFAQIKIANEDYNFSSRAGIYNPTSANAFLSSRVDNKYSTFLVKNVLSTTSVPEPSTLAIFALGLMGLA